MYNFTIPDAKRGAFTIEVLESLYRLDCSSGVVVRGSGGVFSSGLDLSIFLEGREAALEYLFKVHSVVKKILNCPGGVYAVVEGDAYGFGVEFLYFVDYAAAARGVKFSLQGVNLGLFPPYTTALGRRLFAYGHLRVMLNRPFTAEEAFTFGVVSKVGSLDLNLFSPPASLDQYVKPRRWLLDIIDEALPYLYKLVEVGTSEESRRRIAKFLRKRVGEGV
ncbi:MAG: enoyl-CoA hydratase/isomerase family protein [Pyrobaculum sp.]